MPPSDVAGGKVIATKIPAFTPGVFEPAPTMELTLTPLPQETELAAPEPDEEAEATATECTAEATVTEGTAEPTESLETVPTETGNENLEGRPTRTVTITRSKKMTIKATATAGCTAFVCPNDCDDWEVSLWPLFRVALFLLTSCPLLRT
jgi:hypothetical protein